MRRSRYRWTGAAVLSLVVVWLVGSWFLDLYALQHVQLRISSGEGGLQCYRWSSSRPHDWNNAKLSLCADIPLHVFDFEFSRDALVFVHFQKVGGTTLSFKLATIVPSPPTPPCYCTRPPHTNDTLHLMTLPRLVEYLGEGTLDKTIIKADNWNQCRCYRSRSEGEQRQWLYTMFTSHFPCGMHAPLQVWRECLPEQVLPLTLLDTTQQAPLPLDHDPHVGRMHLITFLRHPRYRFMSEFAFVFRQGPVRGWRKWEYACDDFGHTAWRNVSWQTQCEEQFPGFMDDAGCADHDKSDDGACPDEYRYSRQRWNMYTQCTFNPAFNRLTRLLMTADDVGCSGDRTEVERRMLASAKKNLLSLPFFGLSEFRRESELLLEHSLGVRLSGPPGSDAKLHMHNPLSLNLTRDELHQVLQQGNHLDVQLWEFAQEVFWSRYFSTDLPPPLTTQLPDL